MNNSYPGMATLPPQRKSNGSTSRDMFAKSKESKAAQGGQDEKKGKHNDKVLRTTELHKGSVGLVEQGSLTQGQRRTRGTSPSFELVPTTATTKGDMLKDLIPSVKRRTANRTKPIHHVQPEGATVAMNTEGMRSECCM